MRKWFSTLLTLALLAAPAAPVRAAGAGPAGISGQLTGVAGAPLAGAEVEVFQFGAGRVASLRTDDEGYFRFSGAGAASVYWVRAWAPGYRLAEGTWTAAQSPFLALSPAALAAAVTVRAVDPDTGALVPGAAFDIQRQGQGRVAAGNAGGTAVELPAGSGYVVRAWAPGRTTVVAVLPELAGGVARAVTVELPPAAGRVTGAAVAAPDGSPLPGAVVQVIRSGFGVVGSTAAGADGSFAFTLPAGAGYQVRATAPGYAAAVAAPFTLGAGGVQDLSGEQRLALQPAAGALAGRLADPDGQPLAGVTVWLQRRPFGTVAAAETDADGRFRFGSLPARPGVLYRVQVLPGDSYWQAAATAWAELAPGRVTDVALQAARGVISDLAATGGVTGTVQGAGGRPVDGARVELWREGSGLLRTLTTGAGGTFRFTGVPASRGTARWSVEYNGYYLKVSAPGMHTTTLAADQALMVAANRDTAVNVTLYPQQVTLTGRVAESDGAPVAGAAVTLEPEAGGDRLQAATDAQGRWQVAAADPLATYRLAAVRVGYRPGVAAELAPDPAGGGARDVTLYPETATLSGQVTDPYGTPVPHAAVTIWSPDGELPAAAGTDGRYTLRVPAGQPYLLTAAAPGAASGLDATGGAALVAAPAPGERAEADLRLWPAAGKVGGAVLTAAGRPAPGVGVELVREGHGAVARTATDAAGRYSFAGVAAGHRYAVRAAVGAYRHAGQLGLPQPFTLVPGTVHNVHLEVPAP